METNVEDTNDFRSFKYYAKLIENTECDGANGILRKKHLWCR